MGAGSFELKILEISNDNNHLLDGSCCGTTAVDDDKIKTNGCPACATAFQLCLKEFQGEIGFFGCAFGQNQTQVLGSSSFVLHDRNVTITVPFIFRWTVSILLYFYFIYL